jgi:hypothetical protein
VKCSFTLVAFVFLVASGTAFAQGPDSSSDEAVAAFPPAPAPASPASGFPASGVMVQPTRAPMVSPYGPPPFSRISVGGAASLLGMELQLVTNVNQHLNLRAIGNVFKYSNSLTISGVPTNAKLNLGSAGGMVDYYPFRFAFRLSGGLLFVNHNGLDSTTNIPGGDTLTLNGQNYYSANSNSFTGATPLHGRGHLAMNTTTPSYVVSTGWGNHLRRSGHWSFPVEIGVAFVGTPKVTTAINGWACTDATQTHCTNIADPNNPIAIQFQNNLNAQVAKWNSNVSWLKTYPIFTSGVTYTFNTRRY